MSEPEIAVNIRLYNNRLRRRRLEAGMNYRELAEATGIPQSVCGSMERAAYDPLAHNSVGFVVGWRKPVLQIAKFWRTTPDELFPEALRTVQQFEAETATNVADLHMLSEYTQRNALPPDHDDSILVRVDKRRVIERVLKTLSPREEAVLRMRFDDEMTLDEVGGVIGTCGTRVRQIEAKALRKLRHPKRSRPLWGLGPTPTHQEIAQCEEDARIEIERQREAEEEMLRQYRVAMGVEFE